MDRRYSNYSQHRQSRNYGTATPSDALPSTPTKPELAASPFLYDRRERRHSEKLTEHRSHSPAHNSPSCDNTLCRNPTIAEDERLYLGPDGLSLCSRCYKRFKVERRRARETGRAMTDDWKRPKRRRSKQPPISNETLPRPASTVIEDSPQNSPLPDEQVRRNRRSRKYNEQSPVLDSREGQFPAQPPPYTSDRLHSDRSPSLYNFSASSEKNYDHRTSRKHRSRHTRDERGHARKGLDVSLYDEAEFYKYGRVEEGDSYYDNDRRCCCSFWSRRRKCVVFGSGILIVLLIIIIAVAVTVSRRDKFSYTPSFSQVNNTMAFTSGGATRKNVNDTEDGIGAGTDKYTYYHGDATNFPNNTEWVSFKDMWNANLDTFKNSCGWLKRGDDNTPEMIQDIYNAIQDRANASLVDHRIILATIIQETNGCPLSPPTTSSGGTRNPGLMQSHDGHAYNAKHSRLSIMLMVQDGTQGTERGWGLVDNLNTYGNPYKAMRGYNSGYIPTSGDLSEAAGATACYVSDMANRLTGWVRAESTCPGDAA